LFIQPSKAELLDEIFKYWEKTNLKFGHVIDSVNNDVSYRRTGNTLFSLRIRLDDKSATYGRVADSIFNGLEATGGFYECLHHIGVLIVFFIQERLFKS
jgi:hypothetical protein